ncbi:MAG: hypothetical protein EZS28_025646 [Streblomastix strix]|uniref:Right handed beta helix domain-containing protein n=1 Tax=Streblomastix strix TaxID=222440 RepID=A0A5J4V8K2_9EUKA|nr:MAG: hypothetical protein EZS28_025646 [Streblomastix strix]
MIITVLFVVSLVLGEHFQPLHFQLAHLHTSTHETFQRPKILQEYSKPDLQTDKTSLYNSINVACQYNVSQTIPDAIKSIADALQKPCNEFEGYEITLIDSEHNEYLNIDKDYPGGKETATIWRSNFQSTAIIFSQQKILTVENIEFQYQIVNDSVSPYSYLISTGNVYSPTSLIVRKCIFQSTQETKRINDLYQIYAAYSSKVEITDSIFNGMNFSQISDNSMLYIANSKESILKNCTFQNSQLNSYSQQVVISANTSDVQISIQDCNFSNNKLLGTAVSTLVVQVFDIHNVEITGNTFSNNINSESAVGALSIVDNSQEKRTSSFIVSNNSFSNNKGLASDGFMQFTNVSGTFTKASMTVILNEIFNGSTTDAGKNTVWYEIQYDEGTLVAYFTIPKAKSGKWYQNIYAIIGLVVGLAILIAAIVVIIIAVIIYKKQNQCTN